MEVLRNLQRVTSKQNTTELQVHDLVLIKDQEWRADKWPIGIVVRVHPGADGTVRVATVRTTGKADKDMERKETIPKRKKFVPTSKNGSTGARQISAICINYKTFHCCKYHVT